PDTTLADLVSLMMRHQIKRVPVVEDGRLAGIVSRADLVEALGILAKESDRAIDDNQIRRAIMRAIEVERWVPRSIQVEVNNGVVDLSGNISDERQRAALQVLVENIPGVREMRDHLVWTDTVSEVVVPH